MNQSPLDALADRIARIGMRDSETALGSTVALPSESQRVAGMVEQAIAAMDEMLKRNEEKTAAALNSVAQWMERTDRGATVDASPKRHSGDAAMARTLNLLVGRLEEIDAKINQQSDVAAAPLREAIGRIESRLDSLGKSGSGRQSDTLNKSLKELDGRLAEIAQRLDQPQRQGKAPVADIEAKLATIIETLNRQGDGSRQRPTPPPAPPARRPANDIRRALSQGDLSGALSEISSRQRDLDANATRQRLRTLGARLDGRFGGSPGDAAMDDIKQQIAALAQKFDETPRLADDPNVAALRSELQAISAALRDAAPRRQMSAIEEGIEKLAERIAETREQGLNGRALQPLERQLADIRTMLESNRDSEHLMELARDIQAMKRRMEKVPERALDGDALRDLQSQTAEIRSYVVKSAQKSTGLEALERRIAAIADRMEEAASDRSAHDLLAEISRRIDHVHRAVETAPASSIDLAPLETMIQKLGAKIDAVTAGTVSPDVEAAIRALETRLGAAAKGGEAGGEMRELLRGIQAKLDAVDMFNPRSDADVTRILNALDAKIEQIQAQPAAQGDLDRLIQSIEGKLDALQSRAPDMSQLDRMLHDLSAQLERAQAPGASDATLDALHGQIQRIAERLEQSDDHFASLGSLERSISDIFSQLEGMKQALPPGGAPLNDDVKQLVREFTQVKSAQDETDKRTQATLEAVHETLETIVERLGFLEAEMNSADRRPPMRPAAPAAALADERTSEPPVFASAPKRPARLEDAEALSEMGLGPQKPYVESDFSASALLDHAEPAPEPMPFRSGDAERDEPKPSPKGASAPAGIPAIDLDQPLEPGAGRPILAGEAEGEASHLDRMQTARAKFIDAARRAALAAAEQSADALDPHDGNPRSTVHAEDPKGKKGAGRYKKPLLLGLAAIALAAGGLNAYQQRHIFLGSPKPTSSPQASATSIADPAREAKPAGQASGEAIAPPVIAVTPAAAPAAPSEPAVQPAPPVDEAKKVSSAADPADPIAVGAIQSRRLPALAQPPARPQPGNGQAGLGQAGLGLAHIGTTPSSEAAFEALRQQAEAGNTKAQYDLGSRYVDGRGTAPDMKLAVQWLEKAAANGFAPAQYRLGSLYRDGKGIRNDAKLAYAWFKRAAEQGNARAMHNLAVVLAEGSNGTPDYAAAAEWFRKGAEYGIKDSQFNIAILYARGLGIQQDLVQSYKWFAAAADLGDDDAAKKRDEIAAKLTPDKLAEAKAAAQSYRPKPLDPLVNDIQLAPQQKPVALAPVVSKAQAQSARG